MNNMTPEQINTIVARARECGRNMFIPVPAEFIVAAMRWRETLEHLRDRSGVCIGAAAKEDDSTVVGTMMQLNDITREALEESPRAEAERTRHMGVAWAPPRMGDEWAPERVDPISIPRTDARVEDLAREAWQKIEAHAMNMADRRSNIKEATVVSIIAAAIRAASAGKEPQS
jgi:hypothetical protein